MRAALTLARRSLGSAWPNPAVGCVLVKDGAVVGRGWTQVGGRPHAEAVALAQAGEEARGATAYVTLEPCAHYGVTPPCAGALAKAGVIRVVSALDDPDPRVDGGGHRILRAAGVALTTHVLEQEAAALNIGYLLRQRVGRPMLTLKLAAALDGRIATSAGESRWISAKPARERAHLLRAEHDVVLVGAGTALADDPSLDVRLDGLAAASPVPVVADSRLSTPLDGRLARSAPQRPLWLLHGPQAPAERRAAWEARGARLLEVGIGADGRLDPSSMMTALGGQGATRVFCEGGGRLAAALIRAGVVDRLIWCAAGVAIGADGAPALGPLGGPHLADAPRFDLERLEQVGPDVWSEWRPTREG